MSEAINIAYDSIDAEYADESASTRRRFVGGAAATLGSMGLLGLGPAAERAMAKNDPQKILNIAATAEVLATIVNTVGAERVTLDAVTKRNIEAAAREELIHFEVLRGALDAKPATKMIWVPDAVFASPEGLLNTLVAGDQIFINAYLIGTTVFSRVKAKFARFTGEFMGAEAVHRALALQSLGQLGNDRAFMRYEFTNINKAVSLLQRAGFGFGEEGATPGAFYNFDEVKQRTPDPAEVNTRKPR